MIKLIIKFQLVVVISLMSVVSIVGQDSPESQNEKLSIFEKDGKFGYKNERGKVVIEPKFDFADDFSEGLASVGRKVENEKYRYAEFGYVNKKGDLVIPYQFYFAASFDEGVARVIEPNFSTYAKINKCGRILSRGNISIDLNKVQGMLEGRVAYPNSKLMVESNPDDAKVYLIALSAWEDETEEDSNFINNDESLKKYRINTGNTTTKVNARHKVYRVVFVKNGYKRTWVKVDFPRDETAKAVLEKTN